MAQVGRPHETTVLEAGCGVGLYALSLARLGYWVTAFDYNEGAIRHAEAIRNRVGLSTDQVHFFVDNLLAMRAADDSFDLVFNQAVLEYFCDDAELE